VPYICPMCNGMYLGDRCPRCGPTPGDRAEALLRQAKSEHRGHPGAEFGANYVTCRACRYHAHADYGSGVLVLHGFEEEGCA
jgi:hypothetical protein